MSCIICNGSTRVLYSDLQDGLYPHIPGTYTLKKCNACELIFIDPLLSEEELNNHIPATNYDIQRRTHRRAMFNFIGKIIAKEYFGYGENKGSLSRLFLWPLWFRFSDLPYYVKNGRLLDVGCGPAVKMPFFQKLGWRVEGIEIDPRSAEVAKESGFKVYTGSVEEVNLSKDYFDVVYLSHVLEHLRRPHEALYRLKRALKSNGELILTVPNGNSLAHRLFKHHWFGVQIPRHMFTYNRKSLFQLLHSHGFNVEEVSYRNTLSGIASSLFYRVAKPAPVLYLEKVAHFLSVFLDPIFNIFEIGGYITVRVSKNQKIYNL